MKRTGEIKRIPPSRCCGCKAEIEQVEEVRTLGAAGTGLSPEHAEPASYDWACPECGLVCGWDVITDKETDDDGTD